jgi:hypothetical protein
MIFYLYPANRPAKGYSFPCQEYIPDKIIATKDHSITLTGVFSASGFLIIVNGDGSLQTSPIFAFDLILIILIRNACC